MRSLVPMGGLVLMLTLGSVAAASTHKCRFDDHCYTCVLGTKLDGCFLDCNVCGGTRCFGPGSVAEAELEELASTGPLEPLLRFPAKRLGEVIHPSVAEVYDWFWQWRDAPLRSSHTHDELDLEGGVKVDGKPRDFTLSVRQHGDAQIHLLRIQSIGRFVLTVHPSPDQRHVIEFDTYPEGEERGRSGFLRSEPQ